MKKSRGPCKLAWNFVMLAGDAEHGKPKLAHATALRRVFYFRITTGSDFSSP